MYEYRVLALGVGECEKKFNEIAQQGCRMVTMVSNIAKGYGVIVALERKAEV